MRGATLCKVRAHTQHITYNKRSRFRSKQRVMIATDLLSLYAYIEYVYTAPQTRRCHVCNYHHHHLCSTVEMEKKILFL